MSIEQTPLFKKAFKKRIAPNYKLVVAVSRRIQLFEENPFHPLLRNHSLTGSLRGFRAFSVTGDIRIIYHNQSAEIKYAFWILELIIKCIRIGPG